MTTRRGVLHFLARLVLATCGLAWGTLALAAPHQVSVSFSPRTITMGQTAVLDLVIKSPAGGGNGTFSFSLALPTGLTNIGYNVGSDCSASGSNPVVASSSTGIDLSGIVLRPGGTCTVDVTVSPTSPGLYSYPANSVQVNSNSGSSGNASGTTLTVDPSPDPTAVLSATSLGFASQLVGTTSSAQTVTLSNTGGSALGITQIAVSGDFTSSGCSAPSSVAAGSSCTFSIAFRPTATGTRSGSVDIATSIGTRSIALSGTGTAPAASLAPTSVGFGNVAVGSSPTSTVTLTNTGSASLSGISISASGAFFSQTNACPASLAAGASCAISVKYSPTSAGSHSGTLTVQSNASNGAVTASLSGNATAPAVSLSRTSVDFGAEIVNASSAAQSVTLSNTGNAPLTIQSASISGDFAFSGCPAGSSVPAGAACVMSITFRPTTTGVRTGSLAIATNAAGSPHSIGLTGSGEAPPTAPALSLSSSSLAFGSQLLGTRSAAQVVVAGNTGTAPLKIISVAASGDFSVTGCSGKTLPAGGSCTLSITFQPSAVGARSGSVQIASDAPGSPHSIALSGIGAGEAGVGLTPSSVGFGSISAGTSSVARVVVTNTGHASLAISSISITGAAFSQTNTCPASLAAGSSCDVWVTFAPATSGEYAGQLIVSSNASSGGVTIATLSGKATPADAPRIELSRANVDFGSQTVGSASAAQQVAVRNAGSSPLAITAITASGDFGFSGCETPLTLPAGEACVLSITFMPTATGPRSGQIGISSNSVEGATAIGLLGQGTAAPVPMLVVSPSAIAFGSVVAGNSLVAHVAVSNPGTAALAITSIRTAAAAFSQANDCPASLAPNSACDVAVTYSPRAAGSDSSELVIESNASPGSLSVRLTGTALPVLVPEPRLSRTSLAFPAQFVGTVSAVQRVTLTNAGTGALHLSSIASTGDFGYAGCGYPSTLAPGESCDFAITFKPSRTGTLTGGIEIVSDAPSSPHRISLSGTGASFAVPEIQLSPAFVGFGALRVGANATQDIRLTNAGASTLEVTGISIAGAFFSQSNNCPPTLAVAADCTITVSYAPLAEGAHGAQLRIDSNAVPNPHVMPLSGTGIVVPPPFMTVARALDFGQQTVGTTGRKTLEIGNSGADPLVITGVRIFGSDAFVVEGSCTTIAAAAKCSITLAFTPRAVTEYGARLDIVSNHVGGVVQVELGGAGIAQPVPGLQLSVDGLGYGNQVVGTSSERRTVRLTSSGNVALRLDAFESGFDYLVDAAQCPALLEPGRSCEVAVTFKPVVPGPRLGQLTISSNAGGSPHSVSLTGVGCRFFSFSAARNPDRLCAP